MTLCALLSAFAFGLLDHRTGKIPNWLTGGSFLVAFGARVALEGSAGCAIAICGTVVVALVPALFFFTTDGRAIGGGDVKALAVLGAWLGPSLGLEVELLSFSLLALSVLVVESVRGRLLRLLRGSLQTMRGASSPTDEARAQQTSRRFGPYLALGTALAYGVVLLSEWSFNFL